MILAAYLLLLTFKVTATLACAVYCIRISKVKHVPTTTWLLFGMGFLMRFITQFQGFLYTKSILGIYAGYNFWLILANQLVEVAIISCFLIGLSRIYYGMKASKFIEE